MRFQKALRGGRAMQELTKPLVALGFVVLALLFLTFVSPSPDQSHSVFADNSGRVSELGLRFNLQR
jgi:hypothetical protein